MAPVAVAAIDINMSIIPDAVIINGGFVVNIKMRYPMAYSGINAAPNIKAVFRGLDQDMVRVSCPFG